MKISALPLLITLSAFVSVASAADIGGNVTASVSDGDTNLTDYNLISNAIAEGNGTFAGNFTTNTHTLTIETSFSGSLTFSGVISGSAVSPIPSLDVFAMDNTVILSGDNTFTGDVLFRSDFGTALKLGHANALGAGSGVTRNLGAATLDLNGQSIAGEVGVFSDANVTIQNSSATAASWGGNLTIATNNLFFQTLGGDITVSGNINGGGGVAKNGTHTLTVSGDNSGLTTAFQLWNVQQGTLRLASTNAVGAGVALAGNGTTLDLNGQAVAARPLQAVQNATVINTSLVTAEWAGIVATSSGKDLTFDAASGNITVSGAISGAGHLIKAGTNTLTISSNSSTFTGNITLNAGTTNLDGQSEFIIGASGINNTISGSGAVVLNGQFVFNLLGAGTTVGDSWQIVNVATLSSITWGGTFNIPGFTKSGSLWNRNLGTHYQFNQTTGVLSVIPEPSVSVLVGLAGIAGLFLRRRKRA